MAGVEDETRVGPGRMASPEFGPDYAEAFDEGWQRGGSAWGRLVTETKPFFVTSEFLGTLVVLGALAVTAASSDSFDAQVAWPLAVAIVAAFVFGRGLAKAGSPSRSWDPRETPGPWWAGGDDTHEEKETEEMSTVSRDEYGTQPRGPMAGPRYGYGGMGVRQSFPIETKPFFLTSEFWGTVALIVGLAIAAGTSETIDARLFWTLATGLTAAYILSRGIAKSGTKSRSWDPREDLMQGARERMSNRGD
jgi:hypothetical protein